MRCRIVDATKGTFCGTPMANPPESVPHIGKEGNVRPYVADGKDTVKITLDDGTTLFGYECWWEMIP